MVLLARDSATAVLVALVTYVTYMPLMDFGYALRVRLPLDHAIILGYDSWLGGNKACQTQMGVGSSSSD